MWSPEGVMASNKTKELKQQQELHQQMKAQLGTQREKTTTQGTTEVMIFNLNI